MNKYLDYLVWVCFALIGGKRFFKEYLNYDLIGFPLTFVFAFATGIAFSISIITLIRSSNIGIVSTLKPISYLAVFLLVLSTRLFSFHAATEWHLNLENIDHKLTTQFSPNLLNGVVTGETEESRIAVAQLFYQNYGAEIPYKTNNGSFSVYQPTNEDISIYDEKVVINKQWAKQTEFFRGLSEANKIGSLFLVVVFLIAFFASLFVGLRRANKALNRTP